MRKFDLFAVDTRFKPKRKTGMTNTEIIIQRTYASKRTKGQPSEIIFLCWMHRRQAIMVMDSTVKWGPSIYRFDKNLIMDYWQSSRHDGYGFIKESLNQITVRWQKRSGNGNRLMLNWKNFVKRRAKSAQGWSGSGDNVCSIWTSSLHYCRNS